MRWRDLRDESLGRLEGAAVVNDAARELRWIIERAIGPVASEQSLAVDAPVSERELGFVEAMVSRRVQGEPLQYVLGSWGFRTLDLLVDRRVLIPRPETEVVAGLAIQEALRHDGSVVAVDLGTGSGAIALALAAECWPHIEVWASDASTDALAVARANLAGLGRRAAAVRLVEGDWFSALPDELAGRVDVLVSNPPYVPAGDQLPAEVEDWEPVGALRAGLDGLDDIRPIVAGAPAWLAAGGLLVVEIGEEQGSATTELAVAAGFDEVQIEPDLAGRDRALVARWQP